MAECQDVVRLNQILDDINFEKDCDVKIAIVGASGRMGLELVHETIRHEQTELVAAIVKPTNSHLGLDVSHFIKSAQTIVKFTSDLEKICPYIDAVIDFTAADYSLEVAKICAQQGKALVIGTSGFTEQQFEKIKQYATEIPIVYSNNMSLGINILLEWIKQTAEILGEDFDIEISEMHHKHKKDAPSGTALMLGEAAASGRAVKLREKAVFSRHGMIGERKTGDIGFAALRGGSVIGDHSVMFAGMSEIIELKHHAVTRDIFAKGAIRAALWIQDQGPGLYSMRDVLF